MLHCLASQSTSRKLRDSRKLRASCKSRTCVFLLVSSWGLISAPTFAQDTLDKLPTNTAQSDKAKEKESVTLADVRQALRDLDSDTLADRDAAEKKLIAMGPAVVPYLPEVSGSTSGEMKIRLQRIREQLQNVKIETYFQPSMISLSGKMSLQDAIDKIGKQSGNRIVLENADALADKEIELNLDKQPFWKAMHEVLQQGSLRINAYSGNEGMALNPKVASSPIPGPEPYASGPFQIRALSVQSSTPFESSLAGQLDISLMVTWEPRMKPVFLQLPMSKLSAQTDDGTELKATNPEAAPEVPINSAGCSTQLDLQLMRPQRSARKLKKLSGEFVMAIPSEKHKYVFDKFASGKRQTEKFGEVTVTLEKSQRNGSVYEFRILAEFKESQGALDSFRGWILSNQAYLLDANQNRLENVGFQTYAVTNDAVGVSFLFQINGKPDDYTLIYESPGMITRQTVSFEIENIDLP